MKQGKSLKSLLAELQRQKNNSKDFIINTQSLELHTDKRGNSKLHLLENGKVYKFNVNENTHQQISSRLNIPYSYYQKLQTDSPALLDNNVNTFFKREPEKRLIRILDGTVRAFLSNSYHFIDNLDLVNIIIPILKDMKVNVVSADITPTHLYLKAVNKKFQAEICNGDNIQAGFVISNSEVGLGSLKIEPLILCANNNNAFIYNQAVQSIRHRGQKLDSISTNINQISADKISNMIHSSIDQEAFNNIIKQLQSTTNVSIYNTIQALNWLNQFTITQREKSDISQQFFINSDFTLYGLLNAVSASTKDSKSYERATELERIAGEMISLPFSQNIVAIQQFNSKKSA